MQRRVLPDGILLCQRVPISAAGTRHTPQVLLPVPAVSVDLPFRCVSCSYLPELIRAKFKFVCSLCHLARLLEISLQHPAFAVAVLCWIRSPPSQARARLPRIVIIGIISARLLAFLELSNPGDLFLNEHANACGAMLESATVWRSVDGGGGGGGGDYEDGLR